MVEENTGGFGSLLNTALNVFGEIRVAETQRDLELARVNEMQFTPRAERTTDETAAEVRPFFGLGVPETGIERANLFMSVAFVGTILIVGGFAIKQFGK
ncbi:MAG: hypothetical protein JKY86_07670 [Gammaproteobacteria bacterium]|nr:hypothetical protein [Gammaproteobacteria bacterium]MBL4572937.1 hypothetical protein [Gammaproteobacteria bacterium]